MRKQLRVGAAVAGGVASLLGLSGAVAALVGDEVVSPGGGVLLAAGVAVVAMIGAALARSRPGIATLVMLAGAFGYFLAFTRELDQWLQAYNSVLGSAAEGDVVLSSPSLLLFAGSTAALLLGGLLAFFGADLGTPIADGGSKADSRRTVAARQTIRGGSGQPASG